jgi:uncharacterized protein with PQ loop repeat
MLWWSLLVSAAAALTPLSYLPTLRRMVVGRTADGVSLTACTVAVVSYGAWLSLARTHTLGMYLALAASAVCAWVTLTYARRWLAASFWVLVGGMFGAVAAAGVAWWSPAVVLAVIIPVDVGWYLRTVRDIWRSTAAAAVSAWGWLAAMAANLAWVAESIRVANVVLVVQCSLLLVGATSSFTVTLLAHRRSVLAVDDVAGAGGCNAAGGGVR